VRERSPRGVDVAAACFEKPEPVPGVRVGRSELDGPGQCVARLVDMPSRSAIDARFTYASG
jgi:hypothetical protein